ncbi:MAG: hypothetical protein PF693_17605 [Spirochaetia bacterium]|jgi:hypothetical protein|nr:hypothetical protein [Spirochaetia bacterium]
MNAKTKLTIFHIHRKDGSSLFLHPFSDSEVLLKLDDGYEIVGLYGNEPRVESLTMLRNDLYRLIELSVKRWMNDIKFIPRFIISAASFLLIYLVASFIIRDPIPIIDELLLSFGGGLAVFFILSKKDQNSEKSSKKRLSLRLVMDKIVFEEDEFVKEVEEILHIHESTDKISILNSLVNSYENSFVNSNLDDMKQLVAYLDKYFTGKIYKKRIDNLNDTEKEKLSKWAEENKIDLSLFVVYKKLKERVSK